MLHINIAKKSVLISALFLSLTGCSLFQGRETTGQYIDDSTITTKIKEAFVGDKQVEASHISVETMQGVVQLSGFVESPKSEARAVQLARQVDGVKSVQDNIIIH